ncbi:Formiminoglutamic iminohydrolase, partial [hydrothermal vent metagenome]
TAYDDPAEMSARIAAAAQTTGIGLTLLPVLYRRGSLDNRPVSGGQVRFGCTRDRYEALMASAEKAMFQLDADCNLGVAPHSLRAVSAQDLSWVQDLRPGLPVHIHIAEQTAEIADVEAAYGARPVEWLLDTIAVDARWCLVHATHMTAVEVAGLAASGSVAGLCPVTECNLGDGIFAGAEFLNQGGRIGIGSDSNVRICLAEELRTLEYSQRLRDQRRVVLTQDGLSVGRTLFSAACRGGAQATNRGTGQIATGQLADLVTLDSAAIHTSGLSGDTLLDGWIFAGDDSLVRDVFSAGRHLVSEGVHKNRAAIIGGFRRTLEKLRAEL